MVDLKSEIFPSLKSIQIIYIFLPFVMNASKIFLGYISQAKIMDLITKIIIIIMYYYNSSSSKYAVDEENFY